MKLRFHAVLGKLPEEIRSLVKIKKVINIKKDVDIPLMNLYDPIQVALLLNDKKASYLRETDPKVFLLGLTHIKIFIDNYYECLALTDLELATAKGLEVNPWNQ